MVTIYEFFEARGRKCGRKGCRGLRKGVEFDIQLESEESVKYNEFLGLGGKRWVDFDDHVVVPLEFGEGGCKEELEAELRKMAPVNGRTVLVFREKCGCPKGRLEVWGAKRVRRIKK
ncbi:Ribosomal protein L34Ae [Artemisia annua]|uniref:Ribosomal protein L34Ae n=1 Tax=Artemisia annua TaxID=35608 RepID=A0A2U1KBM2_ARTAN|nr:Ribosomal protein L34Ae [Artemisia annua]